MLETMDPNRIKIYELEQIQPEKFKKSSVRINPSRIVLFGRKKSNSYRDAPRVKSPETENIVGENGVIFQTFIK